MGRGGIYLLPFSGESYPCRFTPVVHSGRHYTGNENMLGFLHGYFVQQNFKSAVKGMVTVIRLSEQTSVARRFYSFS